MLMMFIAAAAAAGALNADPAPGAGCAAIVKAIEASEKHASSLSVESITDDSAPRVTMRAAQETAEMARIQANIALLGANRCPAYPHAITPTAYGPAALNCRSTLLNSNDQAVIRQACDEDAWPRKGP